MDSLWYVVHFIKNKKTRVVPGKWIKSIEQQLENSVNNSLNRLFNYLVYYTEKPESMKNGMPDPDFAPKFYMDVDVDDIPAEGCYLGRTVKVKGKFFCIFVSYRNI